MALQGYSYRSAAIQTVQDNNTQQPSGSTVIQSTPLVPAALAQTSANSGSGVPYYTKSSSTVLVLTLPTTPGFTTSSKMGVFWTTSGTAYYCLDCTITSIVGDVITITAPGSIPTGMSNFATVTAGTTVVTFSLATIATGDLPSNPDITDVTLAHASVQQLVLCCPGGSGGFELIDSGGPTLLLAWNDYQAGQFFDSLTPGAPTWSGTANTLRFYNSTMSPLPMKLGAILT